MSRGKLVSMGKGVGVLSDQWYTHIKKGTINGVRSKVWDGFSRIDYIETLTMQLDDLLIHTRRS